MTRVSDFTFYWIAVHHFVTGRNPYAPDPAYDLIMLAPPWVLPLLSPLGWLPLTVAESAWFVISVSAFVLSVSWLWQLYEPSERPLWAARIAVGFAPVVVEFVMGQMDMLMLLGIAGFLRYHQKRPATAGAFLFLVALKPQIAFLMWPGLLLYAMQCWKPLAAFLATLLGASLAALAVHRSVFLDYWKAYKLHQSDFYQTAALGTVLHAPWLFYVLPIAALIYFVWRWQVTKPWDWKGQMPSLLLASMVASPHVWFADHVLLIPAVFQVAGYVRRSPARQRLAAIYFGLNVSLLCLLFIARQTFWYGWIILIWICLYVFAMKKVGVGDKAIRDLPPGDSSSEQHRHRLSG